MTAIKCIGVRSASFANLQRYIEGEGKFMGRRTLNIADEERWAREMDETALIEGVAGRTRTRGYHIVLAFRPGEVAPRRPDGELDLRRFGWCLDYAEEYCLRQMPGLQCAMGAHLETSDADGSERIAVHVVAARPVVAEFAYPDRAGHVARVGTLFDRCPSVVREQVACVRALDAECGLSQLRRGGAGARAARGRTGAERAIASRGAVSWKEGMRLALASCVPACCSLGELEDAMSGLGYRLDLARSRGNITVYDGEGHRARVSTLGLSRARIEEILEGRAAVLRALGQGAAPGRGAHRPLPAVDRGSLAPRTHLTMADAHATLPAGRGAVVPRGSRLQARMVVELLRLAELSRKRSRALLAMESRESAELRRALAAAAGSVPPPGSAVGRAGR